MFFIFSIKNSIRNFLKGFFFLFRCIYLHLLIFSLYLFDKTY